LSPGSRDRTEGEYGEDVVDGGGGSPNWVRQTDMGKAIRGWAHKSGFGGRVGCRWVRKKYNVDRNASQVAISRSFHFFLSSRNLTGGPGVRGKTDPN
jgi:hypothetical protein